MNSNLRPVLSCSEWRGPAAPLLSGLKAFPGKGFVFFRSGDIRLAVIVIYKYRVIALITRSRWEKSFIQTFFVLSNVEKVSHEHYEKKCLFTLIILSKTVTSRSNFCLKSRSNLNFAEIVRTLTDRCYFFYILFIPESLFFFSYQIGRYSINIAAGGWMMCIQYNYNLPY